MESSTLPDDQSVPSLEGLTLIETETKPTEKALADDTDITKRRVVNDYSSYKPISLEPGKEQIRLLQIVPAENDDDELVCVLFDAPAAGDYRIIYIALSYCWGDMTRQRTISLVHHRVDEGEKTTRIKGADEEVPGDETIIAVDTRAKQTFNVTESLYLALRSLRKAAPRLAEEFPILDHQPIWIDALCINQSDMAERNRQVGMMGSIYSRAWFVFIWLGDDDDVMRGLNLIQAMISLLRETWGSAFDMTDPDDEHIRTLLTAQYKLDDELLDPESCFQILERLFAHPYFRRIWVLQEATINIRHTWIHVTKAQVPWIWIIVADRFRTLWRKTFYTAQSGTLPIIWGQLLDAQVARIKAQDDTEKSTSTGSDTKGDDVRWKRVMASLYPLFINTYEQFQASDLRDKLYALLDLALETSGIMGGRGTWRELVPDYGKSVSEVYRDFTLWCIQRTGNLELLSLLASGPRRLMPEDVAAFPEDVPHDDDGLPESCLDARVHPSWAVWPTQGGEWSVSSLTRAQNARQSYSFDLASEPTVKLFNLKTHPLIQLPEDLASRFLSLGGKTIGTVKSVSRMPLRCFALDGTAEDELTRSQWSTEEMQRTMEKHKKSYKLCLTHPYRSKQSMLDGGLAPLWYFIRREVTDGTVLGDEVVEVRTQEWLGREGGRYEGKDELMLRDFLETLLLSPVYRGASSLSWDGEGIPDGPWNDPIMATSFALFWAPHDPEFSYFPPRLAEFFTREMFARGIPRDKVFPFLFMGHGKCFFITEDERMGLCPPETQPGDLVVALYGSRVPFVVRPVRNEEQVVEEEEAWTFKGHERLRSEMYRFIGECYVHERMSKAFFDEYGDQLEETVFNLC